jgi:hypothetical protein
MKHEFAPLPAGYKMSEERAPKEELKTFREWSDLGCMVIKGSVHVGRNKEGVCLFSSLQVIGSDWAGDPDDYYDEDELDMDMPGNPMDYGDR